MTCEQPLSSTLYQHPNSIARVGLRNDTKPEAADAPAKTAPSPPTISSPQRFNIFTDWGKLESSERVGKDLKPTTSTGETKSDHEIPLNAWQNIEASRWARKDQAVPLQERCLPLINTENGHDSTKMAEWGRTYDDSKQAWPALNQNNATSQQTATRPGSSAHRHWSDVSRNNWTSNGNDWIVHNTNGWSNQENDNWGNQSTNGWGNQGNHSWETQNNSW